MTEPDDRELEQYLKGDSKLSRRYREAGGETAPPELDEAVLARARAEARRKPPSLNRLLAPVALAASVLLGVNLAWNLRQAEPLPPVPGEAPAEAPKLAKSAGPAFVPEPPPAAAPEPKLKKAVPGAPAAPAPEEQKRREAGSVAAQASDAEPHALIAREVQAATRARLQGQEADGASAPATMPADAAEPAPAQPAKAESLRSGVLPRGWVLDGSTPGDYDAGTDESVSSSKTSSLYLWCSNPDTSGFGTLMTRVSAERYRGKRVRLTADVQTQDVADWAGLWMRVDGDGFKRFDNMANRPIRGDTSWLSYSVVLDVGPSAVALSYGVLLQGRGTVWIDRIRIEIVVPDAPETKP